MKPDQETNCHVPSQRAGLLHRQRPCIHKAAIQMTLFNMHHGTKESISVQPRLHIMSVVNMLVGQLGLNGKSSINSNCV